MAASLSDYTALVTTEHRDKPRFMATLGALVQPLVDQMNVLQSMPGKFDLDNAVGVQLDDVGLWVGVSRKIRTPLTGIYFSFDVAGLGFDQGIWKGPFDPDTGLTVLDDDTYRLVIRAKIGANHWDGTLASSAAILNSIFGNPSGDLVSVHANGEVFGTGDGVTKNFPLTYGGAQVRRVDSATLYRNDWQGNQQLYPTARTNQLTNSSVDTNSGWNLGSNSIRVGNTTAPDGTNTATIYQGNASAPGNQYVGHNEGATLVAGATYTASVWAKLISGSAPTIGQILTIEDSLSPNHRQTVNFIGSGISTAWKRFSVTFQAQASVSGTFYVAADFGQGVQVAVWGAQLERGQLTSYIPTTTAPVTVTDYSLSSSGVAQLAAAPTTGAKLSWTGDGAVYQQGTRVFIEDHQDMSMTIGIAGKVPSAVFLALLAGGYIPLKPEGVRVAYTVVTSVDGAPLFGFDMDNELVAGFDTGVWGTAL